MFQPMPADYPYEDNGFYEILDYTNGVYTVKRLNDSYGEISDWHGFYSTGVNQEHVLFFFFVYPGKGRSLRRTWPGRSVWC